MNYVSEVADDEKWGGKIEDSRMSEIGENKKQRKRVAVGENMKWRYERAPEVGWGEDNVLGNTNLFSCNFFLNSFHFK